VCDVSDFCLFWFCLFCMGCCLVLVFVCVDLFIVAVCCVRLVWVYGMVMLEFLV
jgi:hypothetical protein